MNWLPVVPTGSSALFLRIARAIADDVRAGRIRQGERLPGARTLALGLGVHRNTVAAAYRELCGEGWLYSVPRGGMRVAVGLGSGPGSGVASGVGRARSTKRTSPPTSALPAPVPRLGFVLPDLWLPPPPETQPPGILFLQGGQPDLRLLPLPALGRAWRRALRGSGRKLVDYGDPRGLPSLREALAGWLRGRRGLAVGPEGIMVTRGAQQALYLLAHGVFARGDRVAVEALGYPPAWAALRLAGLEPVPVRVDAEGMDVDALAALDVRGVYLTPHHQYPTMVALSPARRQRLLGLAADRRMVVVEDDYDHELHYFGRPRLPLAHADPAGVVVYVGTLSKALAPGLRVGFVAAPPEVLDRLARLRVAVDRQGDAVTERAVAELLEEGEVDRHIARMHRVYSARGALLAERVRAELGVEQPEPEGGLALWVRSPVDPERLRAACLRRGVGFRIGREYRFDGGAEPHLRLGYANLAEDELRAAMGVIGAELRGLVGGAPGAEGR